MKSCPVPTQRALPAPQQRFYPRLHLFYSLALAGSLFQRIPSGSSIVLEPTDRLYDFRALSNAGQYFVLMEKLWVDYSFVGLSFDSRGREASGLAYGLEQILLVIIKGKPGVKISADSLSLPDRGGKPVMPPLPPGDSTIYQELALSPLLVS